MFVKGRARHARIEENIVLGQVRQWLEAGHTLQTRRKPICSLRHHILDTTAFHVVVKLSEDGLLRRRAQGVVAQHMALAGLVAN
ncbi:MAG: hypothetical protein DMG21_06815 [Acidobacteria bacterium]|nr:MAG: hypothetical protein DMG21_06815 [Acidobacteriota bacterium]